MKSSLAHLLHRLASWLSAKSAPAGLTGNQWSGTTFVDAFKREREPTPNELMAELKNTAFTCASLNASVCASFPPRLFVTTADGQPRPKCRTRALSAGAEVQLRHRAGVTKAARIEEVVAHPLLTLFQQVNPIHNSFDLWELTTLYQEVHGNAFWYLQFGPFGVPDQIWILPSQNVTPRRKPGSRNIVDYYEYRAGPRTQNFAPQEIIHFRYPDPRDPYTAGLSPLRAAWEQVTLVSDYTAYKNARIDNRAIPDAIVSPDEIIGEEERDRLESQWNAKFRRGGSGRVVVAESGLKVQLLNQSMGDVAQLAEMGQTKEDICNAFHIPIAFLTAQTNLANLQASERLHMTKAVAPRLQRRDQKLNEQLLPLYDPSGRLFLVSDDPIPLDQQADILQQEADLKFGVVTINELRGERGLPAVPWGETPWLPVAWAPADQKRGAEPPRP